MTDLELFDRAVYSYLSDLSSKVVYGVTSKAIQTITKNASYKDAIPYNFISYYRDPTFEIDTGRDQFTGSIHGDLVRMRENDDSSREARYVHNIPVNLTYQIDIWAIKETNVQETSIALMQKLKMTNAILVVEGMNPDGESARFHFTNISWSDNSDLEAENEKGRLYRHTISVTVDARIKLTRDVPTTEFCVVPIDIYNNNEGD